MYVADRDTFDDAFCGECGNITAAVDMKRYKGKPCEECHEERHFNTAHMAYYANLVLEDLGMETLAIAFWAGLWEGRGDTSTVPDDLLAEVEKELVAGMQQVFEETKAEIQASLDSDWQRVQEILQPDELPEGDEMLYCSHCDKRTQHTATITLPGGYPLFECVICDGERI